MGAALTTFVTCAAEDRIFPFTTLAPSAEPAEVLRTKLGQEGGEPKLVVLLQGKINPCLVTHAENWNQCAYLVSRRYASLLRYWQSKKMPRFVQSATVPYTKSGKLGSDICV